MLKIKPTQKSELDQILNIQIKAYQSEAELVQNWSIPPLTQTLEGIQNDFSEQKFLSAWWENNLVGSVRFFEKNKTCYLGRLIVLPDFQGQGIGSQLIKFVETLSVNSNRIELFTGSLSKSNIRLYQKHGFSIFKTENLNDVIQLVYLEKER